MSDDEMIDDGSRPGFGIALVILFAAIFLMVVFLFRNELGIPIPDVSVSQPERIPEGAMSVADQRAADRAETPSSR